ncbi:MAG: hypothetical protein K2R98_20200 [Gemmataceae bacterium]|nr:hypothetical protein [Gemmataceae bacterium]
MRLKRRCFLALVPLLVTLALAPAADEAPLKVLFIGNSYTYVNDLPLMLDELAKAGKQRPLEIGRELPGGCTLEKHWKDGKALKKIGEKKWDYVVLQEHSVRPIKEPKLMVEYGTKLDAEAKKQGAKTILYLTWARQNAPRTQADLSKAYLDLAGELKASVAPVGIAWEAALKDDSKLVLHSPDMSHPSKTGTYLAACVFYGTIYGKSPEGLPGKIGGLTDEEAKKLQAIAWKVVQEGKK